MKFLFVANLLGDENSGAAGHIIQLTRALKDKGHIADHLFRDDFIKGIKRNIFLNVVIFLFFPAIIIPKIFYRDFTNHYDFVIISSGDGFLYAIFVKSILHKRRSAIIMRSHGYEYLYKSQLNIEKRLSPQSYFTPRELTFFSGFRLIQVKIFSFLCDSIFCLNKAEKAYLERLYPKKRIFAVPIGINPMFMSRSPSARDRDILFIGGWCRMKGRVYFADIINRLNEDIKNLTVSIIGTGVDEKRALKDFRETTRERIRVIEKLPQNMLEGEYAIHKVFLFPSLFEGYGNVILEAMASGMAVVVSKDLGASEIITNGYNGYLIEKRDVDGFVETVKSVLKNEDLRKKVGQNARMTVSNMTWDRIADMFVEKCKELLKGDW